jgi:sugar lactone lactonase YvrE
VGVVEGLAGPESVRYDPEQDVWFVGNFNGAVEGDANGFVTRVDAATGAVEAREFAVGTEAHPLHAARGMYLTGDTLWVADAAGVHLFHRRSGEQLGFVDLSPFDPGFPNDIAQGPDGALYVTDTGRSAVYRVEGRGVTEAVVDTALGGPNGVTFDPELETLVLVPWEPGHPVHRWSAEGGAVPLGPGATAGRLDGVERVEAGLLVASQADSTLSLVEEERLRPVIRVPGAPADMGVDTRRGRVAVPYVALDRVDIWRLPGG